MEPRPTNKSAEFTNQRGVERLRDPTSLLRYKDARRVMGTHLLAHFPIESDYREAIDTFGVVPELYPQILGFEGINNILTSDYVNQMTNYLWERTKLYQAGNTRIEEVGAGPGARLTRAVMERAQVMGFDLLCISASDNVNSEVYPEADFSLIAREHYRLALSRNPQIVISSWMPPGEDWTIDFRKTASVREYVLAGDPKACGTPEAWGSGDGDIIDGFQRFDLPDLTSCQLGSTDELRSNLNGHRDRFDKSLKSITVSFRRI